MKFQFNEACEYLDINPETGIIIYKKSRGHVKAGVEAGNIQSNGYRLIRFNGKCMHSHRIVWTYVHGEMPDGMQIDHINGIRDDNRICNLRCVTQFENMKNAKIPSTNKTGSIGVSLCKQTGLWRASIGANGKARNLGRYENFEDALKARARAEMELGFHENHGRK